MTPNLTVFSMADTIARGQLDAKAARGWQAAEAVAGPSALSRLRGLRWTVGAVLVRAGAHLQGSAKGVGAARPLASEAAR